MFVLRHHALNDRAGHRERGGEEAPTLRTPQQQPSKDRKDGRHKNPRKVYKAAMLRFVWAFVRKLETRVQECNQKPVSESINKNEHKREARPQLSVHDKDGILLENVELSHERKVPWFDTLVNPKLLKIDPDIAEDFDQVAREHATRSSVHDTGADRRHLLERTERLSDRTESPLRCSRSNWTVKLHTSETARYRDLYLEGGGVHRTSENNPPS